MANAIEHHLRHGALPFARFRGSFIVDSGRQAFERCHACTNPVVAGNCPERRGSQDWSGIIGYCRVHFDCVFGSNRLERHYRRFGALLK